MSEKNVEKAGVNLKFGEHTPIELVSKGDDWPNEVTFDDVTVSYSGLQVVQDSDRKFRDRIKSSKEFQLAYTACVNNNYEDFRKNNNADPRTVFQAATLIGQHTTLAIMHYKYIKGVIEFAENTNNDFSLEPEVEEKMLTKARRELFVAIKTVEWSHFIDVRKMKKPMHDLLRNDGYTFIDYDDDDLESNDSDSAVDMGYMSDHLSVEDKKLEAVNQNNSEVEAGEAMEPDAKKPKTPPTAPSTGKDDDEWMLDTQQVEIVGKNEEDKKRKL